MIGPKRERGDMIVTDKETIGQHAADHLSFKDLRPHCPPICAIIADKSVIPLIPSPVV